MGISCCLDGNQGEVAKTVLLPGDPLRAKFIAENFLENVICYNKVRGMYGYTGTYKGKRVSVQGTGMGIPSMGIYVYDLINDHHVENLIRIGTCGALSKDAELRDIILAMSASTDSNINREEFNGLDYVPTASYTLLKKAYKIAAAKGINPKVGSVFSSDVFYNDDPDYWKIWSKHGILAVDMETAGVYSLAAQFKANALSIMTVSDNIITNEQTTHEEREKTFTKMMEIALELAE